MDLVQGLLVRGLQERAARALPAQRVELVDGWWLRLAPGCAWWIATVLPHAEAGPGELARRVAAVEAFYAGQPVSPGFQISPGAVPDRLDALLAGRGYRHRGPLSLQVASTAHVRGQGRGPLPVRLDDRVTRAWFDGWRAGRDGDPRAEWDLLHRIDRPAVYASATEGDQVVAVGRAVADTGWVGVFGMVTHPAARGRGVAAGVLAALAGWAESQRIGAQRIERLYLQVEADNIPALRLYRRLGFSELCRYHYRVSGDSPQ